MLLPQEVIRRKRDGGALDHAQIDAFVTGLVDGGWSDAQAAAMAMAICVRGMSDAETVALTQAMTRSGKVFDWSRANLPGPILDKHSTGGVGDKVSLLLAPVVAACGGFVPMISGRGLGHTGGTLDKLDAIPGYRSMAGADRVRAALREAGCAIVGATTSLAPADRRLYAIRDVTATVESIPLITASILSKKLAAGLQGLVMDVKVGNGAFAAELPMAMALAQSLMQVGTGAGLPMRAWVTDMNQVLGRSCGHALEVDEALRFLGGDAREPRLLELVRMLSADLLIVGGIAPQMSSALARVDAVLADGSALERFAKMVAALGGPNDFVENAAAYLPPAPVHRTVTAEKTGWISAVDTRAIGLLLISLGGGRRQADDAIDTRVGLDRVVSLGQRVERGTPLAVVHAASEDDADAAERALAGLLTVTEARVDPPQLMRAQLLPE